MQSGHGLTTVRGAIGLRSIGRLLLAGACMVVLSAGAQVPAAAASPAASLAQGGADQPATAASVERLIDISGGEKLFDAVMLQTQANAMNMANQMGLQPQDRPAFDRYMQGVMAVLNEEMGWQSLKPQMVQIYERRFTEADVLAMIAFYETPAGQRMLALMPVVMGDINAFTQERMHRMVPRMQALAAELRTDVTQRRALNPATGKASGQPEAAR